MALTVGIVKIIKTNKPTKNTLIKLNKDTTGLIFKPKPLDK